jgi:hypothetical protein
MRHKARLQFNCIREGILQMFESDPRYLLGLAVLVLCALSGCPQPDTTPPGNVAGLAAQPLDPPIKLSWTNPADSDFSGIKVQRKTGG